MNYKGVTPFDRPYGLPQFINVADQQIDADSLQQIDREEMMPPGCRARR